MERLINALIAIFGRFPGISITKRFKWTGYVKPMESVLILDRKSFTDISTIGELSLAGERLCFTLEDTSRDHKIPGSTAIPAGKYQVIINRSERFGCDLPLLLGVPGFEGVRIHSGNTPKDTKGCILVGMRFGPDTVYDSKMAFQKVMIQIADCLKRGPLFIAVLGGPHSQDKKEVV